ncbi:MAG TPA: phospholipase C, phosphocholine-specific [Verrucomicrobiota bacterium]|nr:phospholipase C, phosphocholine-specific [Verrucomicrobiales bacterium]HRI12486.1 phospholipase C, phosphocholine-specific [Verrucomicrobiota bacterium]
MDSRRDFLKKAALLGVGLSSGFPASIQKALAIDPPVGSTFLDAEHVVILMQENRSFDHCYGSLRGVRGFNDPRAVRLPDGNPVWLQSNAAGETYAPFRLNIHDTKATWMSSLPHSWTDQQDARSGGRHNGWLDAKRSSRKEYAHLPLTLGFYNRDDLPFYYALADAFTVCDQNFCSSLTGTTPNRLHLWTGTIRAKPSILTKANVRNEDVDYGAEASWKTFPERLEESGVSWRVYQNELSLPTGLKGEAEDWLANFTDNPLEWFTQYHVRFLPAYREHLRTQEPELTKQLGQAEAQPQPWSAEHSKKVKTLQRDLARARKGLATYTEANFAKLPPREQNLHRKAFSTNQGDPHYHELASLTYRDGGTERRMEVPRGDVLHQFRQDVRTGKLPTVSWIVAPKNFSDHPGAPWYGAWYLSETLDILTQNPEVWKKTIFVLCYDENDGYFDHVPPFVPPPKDQPELGQVSPGIDTSVEQVRIEQERDRQKRDSGSGRAGPIGLGYRVPLVIASPWSRGGYVCSQVFDHTSIIQLLETVVSHRAGRPVREKNISDWRRVVCGDLSAAFRPYHGEKINLPAPVQRDAFLGSIHQAQFRQVPHDFKKLGPAEIAQARDNPLTTPWLPQQEPGTRPSCALPYELTVNGALSPDRKSFVLQFEAGREFFGPRSAGAPFHIYSPQPARVLGASSPKFEPGRTWAYTVAAGNQLTGQWPIVDFAESQYHLCVHGPNGFFRDFRGSADDPLLQITLEPARTNGKPIREAVVRLVNADSQKPVSVLVEDAAYRGASRTVTLAPAGSKGSETALLFDLARSFGWYDLRVRVPDLPRFEQRFAGRIETGEDSVTDPLMARVVG